jgi:O-antigen/teichoic acid export membrane protein
MNTFEKKKKIMLGHIRSTIKNAAIYGLGNLSTKLIGFVLLPLYTKYLSIADYGVLGIMEVSSQVLIGMFCLGLSQAFARWYWDQRFHSIQRSLFYSTLIILVSVSAVMVLIFIFFTENISILLFTDSSFSYVIQLLIISSALDIIIQAPTTLIRLQEKPVLYTTANIIKIAVSLFFTVYFIKYRHLKLEGIYQAQLIGQVIFILVLTRFIFKNISIKFERQIMIDMLLYAIPLALSTVAAIALNISDRYILKAFCSLQDVGLYSLGYKIANTVNVFIIGSVNLAVLPIIYKMMDAPNHKRFYSKLLTYYVFGVLIFAMGMSFFGKEVIKLLATNPEYWDSYKIIPLIAMSSVFIVMRDTSMTGLLKMQKSKTIATVIVIAACINILLDLFFIKLFGSMGAAIATILAQGVYFIMIYLLSQKAYRIPYEHGKLALMIMVAAILIVLSQLFNNYSLLVRILTKTSLVCIFPVILYFFRFYEAAEITSIKGFWIKWRNPLYWIENLRKTISGNS